MAANTNRRFEDFGGNRIIIVDKDARHLLQSPQKYTSFYSLLIHFLAINKNVQLQNEEIKNVFDGN